MSILARQKQAGFTIVELLIVIVVIGILAAITLTAYNGVQVRARDGARTDSIAKIKRALELYKIDNGQYPTQTLNPGDSVYEVSTDASGSWMEYLQPYSFPGGTPTDPINNASSDYRYWYIRYPAGSGGCDASRGGFYVIWVRYENNAARPRGNSMPGTCTSADFWWSDTGGEYYTVHAFEN